MKPYIVYILLALLCPSCDKTTEAMRIIIENGLDTTISIKLFPKSEYLGKSGDFYCVQSNGSGSSETEFELGFDTLQSKTQEWLYTCLDEINTSPTDLVAKIFDSIHIIVPLVNDSLLIRFLPSGVSGYNDNLFTNVSAWKYEVNNYDYPTQITTTYEKAHEYYFIVSEDKFN